MREYNAKDIEYNGQRMTEYEALQEQRNIERHIRRWKREETAMKAAGLETGEASAKIKSWQEKEKDFLRQTGLKKDGSRSQFGAYSRKEAGHTKAEAEKYYQHWIKGISNEGNPKSLADYYDMKYNNPKEYALLQGYVKAVEKEEIHPLVGFQVYKDTAKEVEEKLIGLEIGGVKMESYTPHFINRVIGQVSEDKPKKRRGVPVSVIAEDLENSVSISEKHEILMPDGTKDIRRSILCQRSKITVSVRDCRYIQVNPKRGGGK